MKKAMTAGFLIAMIITLVSFLLISGTVHRFISKQDNLGAERLCHDSMAIRQSTALSVSGGEIKASPILCKTLDVRVKPQGKDREDIENSTMTQIADKMEKCWWMFGEGKYKNNVFSNTNLFRGNQKCFICYTMLVEEARLFEEGSTITAEEFQDFLGKEQTARYKQSYLDYFQTHGGPGIVIGMLTEQGITPGHAYAIAYKARKDTCGWCDELAIGGASALAAGLFIVALPVSAPLTVGALAIGGTASATYGLLGIAENSGIFDQSFREGARKLTQAKIDSIIFVDLENENYNNFISTTCEQVTDSAASRG